MDQVVVLIPGGVAAYSAKSALFTTSVTDRGTFFDCTGSFTVTIGTTSLTAGWCCWIRNISGTQTLDPSGAILINGAATYAVANAGDVVFIVYDGTNFIVEHTQRPSTVAITGGTIDNTSIGLSVKGSGAFTTGQFSDTVTLATSSGGLTIAATSGTTLVVSSTVATCATFAGGVTVANLTDSGLTSGRVTFAGSAGILSDSANLTWNGSTLTTAGAVSLTTASSGLTIAITTGTSLVVSSTAATCATFAGGVTVANLTDSGLTSGRVTFAGSAGLLSDSANFTWGSTNGVTSVASTKGGDFRASDAGTTNITDTLAAYHRSSGTPAAGFGCNFNMGADTSTNAVRNGLTIQHTWVDATDASRTARIKFFAFDTSAREAIRIESSGSAAMVGFLGANAIVRPAGTGETVGFTAGGGTAVTDSSTFTGNVGATAYRISDVVKALKNLGLLTT